MSMSNTKKNTSSSKKMMSLLETAIQELLESNFDAESQICILTCIKLLDNLLQQPWNSKVRQIRLGNANFQQKVATKKGGLSILLACGFQREVEAPKLLSSPNTAREEYLMVPQQNPEAEQETLSLVRQARQRLRQVAMETLQVSETDLPSRDPPKLKPPPVGVGLGATSSASFNIYQGHRFDGQSAAVGTNLGPPPNWKSQTETKLEVLQQKQELLQAELQKQILTKENDDGQTTLLRQWMAFPPPTTSTTMTITNDTTTSTNSKEATTTTTTKSSEDSALLAAQVKKQLEERQKQAQRGFTTKAMRDLEKIQKQRVYSHCQLCIQFRDGSCVYGNFLPNETIETVLKCLQTGVLQTGSLEYLYMTPPKTILKPHQTLQELGLVPAAKVYAAFQTTTTSSSSLNQTFIRPELFEVAKQQQNQEQSKAGIVKPISKPIVGSTMEVDNNNDNDNNNTNKSLSSTVAKKPRTKAEKEANLLKRMMGGKKGL